MMHTHLLPEDGLGPQARQTPTSDCRVRVLVCFGDDSYQRDARRSHPCEDRRDAETAHQVSTVLSYLCFQLENQTS